MKRIESDSESKLDPRTLFDVADRVFSIPETCAVLKKSRSKLYEVIGAGDLKTVKDGGRRLVTGAAIQNYVRKLAARTA